MQNHIAEFEGIFNRLSQMDTEIDEGMQVAFLLVSISNVPELHGTVSAIKTMQADQATWNYVSTRLIK